MSPRSLWRSFPTRYRLRLGAMCAVLLLLSFVPSVGALGYFYALVTAPLAGLWGIYVGWAQIHTPKDPRTRQRRHLWPALRHATPELALQLCAWLAILACSSLWNPSCDPWTGLGFWALGPAFSFLLGAWISLACGLRIHRKGLSFALGLALFGLSCAFGLWQLYKAPVVFAFDPFFGYFSGPIYDESVKIEARYLVYRGYNLVWMLASACALALFERDRGSRIRDLGWILAGLLLTAVGVRGRMTRAELGFTASKSSIRRELSLQKRTPHFVIYYAPHSASSAQIEALAQEHEFAWTQLEQKLGYAPPAPIESFVFSSPQQKRRLFGAGHVEVSLPWRQQIYLNHQGAPHRVLHHELAHAFGRAVAQPLLGLSRQGLMLNGGLIEGYATALAPRSVGDLDLHDQAAIVDRLDKRPPMSALMGPGFWRYGSSRAYTSAGSFCLWILEQFGAKALSQLYARGGDFEAVTNSTLAQLEARWLKMLRAREIREEDIAIQRARFARRSVFARPCAHRIAVTSQEANHAAKQGQDDQAAELLQELCRLDPGELAHSLRLARFLADHDRIEQAHKVIQDTLARPDLRVRQKAELLALLGDIAWRNGDTASAAKSYDQALTLPIYPSHKRPTAVKRDALDQAPEVASELYQYFRPAKLQEPASAQAARRLSAALNIVNKAPERSIGHYLLGLSWLQRNLPSAAIPALQKALTLDQWSSPLLARNAARQLLRAHWALGHIDQASALLSKIEAQGTPTSGQRLELAQWKARIAHARSYRAQLGSG